MTKTVDQWAAEQCGVELYTKRCTIPEAYDTYSGTGIAHWFDQNIGDYGEWTIKDPRCREIGREHFRIETKPFCNGPGFVVEAVDIMRTQVFRETIAEAEIACIQAIYEAQK